MNSSLRLLAASCALFLVACGDPGTVGSVDAELAQHCNPSGDFKIDEAGPQDLSCPDGEEVTGICIKAGNAVFGAGGVYDGLPQGCYVFDLAGGSVSGGGTGRDCKDISYTAYNCGPGEVCECTVDADCISLKSGTPHVCDGCNCVPEPCHCTSDDNCGKDICNGCYCRPPPQ